MEGEDDIYTKDGTVDYQNNPANKKKTGTWKACPYILGTLIFVSNSNMISESGYGHISVCFA